MFQDYKKDIIAGFSVFLLALPLCLGIAIASQFPPIAGILTAVIGGILGAILGGAKLSIKGPAAGLVVIVLGAVQELGYECTLAIGVVAAIIQIIIAVLRKAIIAEVIPPSVIHGMLAGIGVIIVSKQSYVMLGVTPSVSKPFDLILQLPSAITQLNPVIFGLGLMSFIIAATWPKFKKVAFVPSSFVILILIITISLYFGLSTKTAYHFQKITYPLGSAFFIHLPTNLLDAIRFPDFSQIVTLTSLKYILMFSLVGAVESLLTVCAIDSMTPNTPPSDLNKDLRTLGIANLISALIGGLPMISEIVRSKANIDYGATSLKANFFHGLFMLIAVVLCPFIIKLIPLSALAALLIFVGLKLASPKEFIHAYKVGKDQFSVFLLTFITTLAVDLLAGVMLGIILELIILRARGNTLKQLFKPTVTMEKIQDTFRIEIDGPLTFAGYLVLKNMISKCAKNTRHIIISLQAVTYLDHTALKKLLSLKNQFQDIQLNIEENQQLVSLYNHPLAAKSKLN